MTTRCCPFTRPRSTKDRLFMLPAIALALMTLGEVDATEREAAVNVLTVAPQAVAGRLISFSLRDGAIVQTSEEKRHVPTADIIRMTRYVAPAQNPVAETMGQRNREIWTVTLTWGDVICGRVVGAREDRVVMETADLGEVPIPLDSIARIASARVASDVSGESLYGESVHWLDRASAERPVSRSARSTSETDDDRVLLTNGDVLRGFISAIDTDGIAIDTGTGITTAPFRLVVAARLAHPVPTATPRPYLLLSLRDGGKVTATAMDWSDAGVEARLRGGATVQIDADRVVAVDVIGGRWEWLSALETPGWHRPLSYEQASMLGPGWEYVAGRNVLGGPIIVAGMPYERGIGVHSRSTLVFELNGEYREFVTAFGMDDDSGPLADVTVVVLVDGLRRFEKAHILRGNLFGPIRVDVSHAGRIELIVEYGDNGDMQDRFDWVEPGLIR